jgi:hypothetical protein
VWHTGLTEKLKYYGLSESTKYLLPFLNEAKTIPPPPFKLNGRSLIKSYPEAFFLFRDFKISEISIIVNSIIANFEFVLNSKFGGLQLLSSKFETGIQH